MVLLYGQNTRFLFAFRQPGHKMPPCTISQVNHPVVFIIILIRIDHDQVPFGQFGLILTELVHKRKGISSIFGYHDSARLWYNSKRFHFLSLRYHRPSCKFALFLFFLKILTGGFESPTARISDGNSASWTTSGERLYRESNPDLSRDRGMLNAFMIFTPSFLS